MPSWRLFKAMRDTEASAKLARTDPKPVGKKASKQIKAPKDNHGRRRGSDSN